MSDLYDWEHANFDLRRTGDPHASGWDPREDAYDEAHLTEQDWLDWQRMDLPEDEDRVFWLDYLSALGEFIDVLWRKKAGDPELVPLPLSPR